MDWSEGITGPDSTVRWGLRLERKRLFSRATLVLACFYFLTAPGAGAEKPTLEYQVKAAYLYNFVRFVKWPEEVFKNGEGKLMIGIVGENNFGKALTEIEGEKVWNQFVEVKYIRSGEALDAYHVLFISESVNKRSEIMEAVQGRHILTVGESDGFARIGGVINFVRVADKVRFEINREAAKQAGLEISSQLLKLAVKIYDEAG